jgi:hypothetical protein
MKKIFIMVMKTKTMVETHEKGLHHGDEDQNIDGNP